MNFYENVRAACSRKGTTLTEVLKALGRSTGSTGSWKAGILPKMEIAIEIADHLGISLDELVYGEDHLKKWFPQNKDITLSHEQEEWLDILSGIPESKKQMCKDFLKTHMVTPAKFSDDKMA